MKCSRRQFVIGGLHVSALMSTGLPLLARDDQDAPVLVVIQLTGGNDGLNTVVPFRQDDYYKLRPNIAIARPAVHKLDEELGLHPALAGMAEHFEAGQLAIVQGIGNPNPERSHFRSLEVWHTARPDGDPGQVGWLGRLADQLAAAQPGGMPALAIEAGNLPLSMRGAEYVAPTVHDPLGFRLAEPSLDMSAWRDELLTGAAAGDLAFLRNTARTTYDAARRMTELAESKSTSDYPDHDLAQRLRLVARLIDGRFGTRIFHLSLDGFDTHARQKPVHDELMRQLSSGLSAFQQDLEQSGAAGRVATFVFSEFGRRVGENASKGTDHGRGAPAFVLGGKVRGGLYGPRPDLTNLVEGDIPQSVDFRSVYATLEQRWMGLEPSSSVAPLELV